MPLPICAGGGGTAGVFLSSTGRVEAPEESSREVAVPPPLPDPLDRHAVIVTGAVVDSL